MQEIMSFSLRSSRFCVGGGVAARGHFSEGRTRRGNHMNTTGVRLPTGQSPSTLCHPIESLS
jgi:hypothetical protein